MYTNITYIAEDGIEFNTAQDALDYERPWVNANNLLKVGKNLFEVLTTLKPAQQWSAEEEKVLRNITKDTEIYWRRYKSNPLARTVLSVDLDGKVCLVGKEKNTGKRLTPHELVKHILQF